MKNIYLFLLAITTLASCNFLDTVPTEDQTTEALWSHADYGEGILTTAYLGIGQSGAAEMNTNYVLESYTDNVVPNVPGTNKLALGSWTVENNPIGEWTLNYNMIKYTNLFLKNGRHMPYANSDHRKDSVLRANRIGEAFYLRAWYQWRLLQAYGGLIDGSPVAMGFPIVTKPLTASDNLDIPRNTYEECVAQIAADCDSAFRILPLNYFNGNDQLIGLYNIGRGCGAAALALKARAYLYAASPAFGNSTKTTWERAAKAAYDAVVASGGFTKLADYGNFNNSKSTDNIWSSTPVSDNYYESNFYPPSLYGKGTCNPSQNLVDAFPASDGYPIEMSAVYDAHNPYKNRDARFAKFIFFNGDLYNGITIQTQDGGSDAPGGINQYGTRTGYYMKKLLSLKVSLVPGKLKSDYKLKVYLGKPELYLNYAEAVNEAYGPNNAVLGTSSKDALQLIRKRGITGTDDYLEGQASNGTDSFRTLIQNERRIELCFEGFRFWDMRRMNLPLNHTSRGVKISTEQVYQYVDVENHTFQDYMRYIPVPYDQTLIMNSLKQNIGWK